MDRIKTLQTLAAFMLLMLGFTGPGIAGQLSANIRISSDHLGYDLQYWVYYPTGTKSGDKLPTLYLTDGQLYLEYGKLHGLLDEEIEAGRIKPVIAVFLDPRDPDNWKHNRRGPQFDCNPAFVQFFKDELIPKMEKEFPVSSRREDRVILGLSHGGLNAACFGLMAADTFGGIAMQSPTLYPFAEIKKLYQEAPLSPIKIFYSVGRYSDGLGPALQMRKLLTDKGYDLVFKEVMSDHSWDNWGPLQDDILHTFFGRQR